jgi:hypothetical protein
MPPPRIFLTFNSLIMLLIQSDMFKALWFMIYPIVTFTRGPVPSNSKFCQVNGFFLSLGIEASGKASDSTCRLKLTHPRFCNSPDRSSYRIIYIQTEELRWRRRSLSISQVRIYRLGGFPGSHGITGFHQRPRGICSRRNLLLSPRPAILVSTCPGLDPSICYFHHHSLYIRIDILLRPIQVSRFQEGGQKPRRGKQQFSRFSRDTTSSKTTWSSSNTNSHLPLLNTRIPTASHE